MKPKNYRGQPVRFVQEKLDGHRFRVRKWPTQIRVASYGKDIDVWDKIEDTRVGRLIKSLPDLTHLEVELHCPGVQATSVKTMINEGSDDLQMSAFAASMIDATVLREMHNLHEVNAHLAEIGVCPARIHLSWDRPVVIEESRVEALKAEATELGIEGWVVKLHHYHDWFKIKPIKTVDCVVTGKKQGTGRHYLRLGSLEIAVYDGGKLIDLGNVGTGFSDSDRDELWAADVTGMVVEVSYDSLAAKGKLKFPRFVRIRDDKTPEQCTKEQLI